MPACVEGFYNPQPYYGIVTAVWTKQVITPSIQTLEALKIASIFGDFNAPQGLKKLGRFFIERAMAQS